MSKDKCETPYFPCAEPVIPIPVEDGNGYRWMTREEFINFLYPAVKDAVRDILNEKRD